MLPMRVFVFFLYYLQPLDHLEAEAHYAALLASVLEVDGFVVVVDEDLRHKPTAVVEPFGPLGDVFVLYLLGLLTHGFLGHHFSGMLACHNILPTTTYCLPHRWGG